MRQNTTLNLWCARVTMNERSTRSGLKYNSLVSIYFLLSLSMLHLLFLKKKYYKFSFYFFVDIISIWCIIGKTQLQVLSIKQYNRSKKEWMRSYNRENPLILARVSSGQEEKKQKVFWEFFSNNASPLQFLKTQFKQ